MGPRRDRRLSHGGSAEAAALFSPAGPAGCGPRGSAVGEAGSSGASPHPGLRGPLCPGRALPRVRPPALLPGALPARRGPAQPGKAGARPAGAAAPTSCLQPVVGPRRCLGVRTAGSPACWRWPEQPGNARPRPAARRGARRERDCRTAAPQPCLLGEDGRPALGSVSGDVTGRKLRRLVEKGVSD